MNVRFQCQNKTDFTQLKDQFLAAQFDQEKNVFYKRNYYSYNPFRLLLEEDLPSIRTTRASAHHHGYNYQDNFNLKVI